MKIPTQYQLVISIWQSKAKRQCKGCHLVVKFVTNASGARRCSNLQICKMIQVIDSIPWVRCASGNVYHLFRNLVNFLSPVYEWGRGGRFGPRLDHPHKHLVVICLKAQLLLLSSSQSKGSSIAS